MNISRRDFAALLLAATACREGASMPGPYALGMRSVGKPQPIYDAPFLTNTRVQSAGYATQVSNISFGCIFEAPEWTDLRAESTYWWWFGDHNGYEIRCAKFSSIAALRAGTLPTILGPSNLVSQSLCVTALKALDPVTFAGNSSNNHFNGPDLIFDDDLEIAICHWHGTVVDGSNNGWRHGAGVAFSGRDLSAIRARAIVILTAQGFSVPSGFGGTITSYVNATLADVPDGEIGYTWRIFNNQLGSGEGGAPHYFRPFRRFISGAWQWFCISNQCDLRRSELSGVPDPYGMSIYHQRATFAESLTDGPAIPRHAGILIRGDRMTIAFSRPHEPTLNGEQEHLQMVDVDIASDDWDDWEIISGTFRTLRKSEKDWEGINIAISANPTAIPGEQRILLDAFFFPREVTVESTGEIFLGYTAKGEQSQGLALFNEVYQEAG